MKTKLARSYCVSNRSMHERRRKKKSASLWRLKLRKNARCAKSEMLKSSKKFDSRSEIFLTAAHSQSASI